VIEGRISPTGCVVTGVAGLGKARGYVIRNIAAKGLRLVPIGRVAWVARSVCGGEIVVVVYVAARTGSGRMGASERPSCDAVVECGQIGPSDRVVTLRTACCTECCPGSRMHRIIGLLPGA